MAATVDNIKLPDLITKWMEVQKSRAGLDDGLPLKVDAIDLTLLLKSMGLKLEYLDFEQEKANTDTLTVDIKCNRSGVMARMSYDLVDCSCPEKDEKETSFWEVQATGPKVFSKFKNNTSSNLLPEVSENCSVVSKAMLSNLLDYYRTSIKTVERGEDALHTPKICITSPGNRISCPFATPPAEGKITSRVEISQSPVDKNNVDPSYSPMKPKSLESLYEAKSKPSSEKDDTKSNSSGNSVEIGNTTRELSKSDSDGKPAVATPTPSETASANAVTDDNSFANSEAMKALITSSPNEKDFPAVMSVDQNHERDLNVIHCMQQARQQIDAAILIMRLNNPCQDLSQTSAVTTTPQTVIRKKLVTPKFPDRSGSLSSINRRMSLPGRPSNSPKLSLDGSQGLPKRKIPVTSQLAKPLAARKDTPRPAGLQPKPVTALRKTSSITPVPATSSSVSAKSGTTSSLKKPSNGIKPVGSARTTASGTGKSATAVGRSVSTSSSDKK